MTHLSEKDAEIDKLKKLLEKHDGLERSSEASLDDRSELSVTPPPPVHVTNPVRKTRRGKAPPVDAFTGENTKTTLDDWLPSLKRAATWNEWTDSELLLQLAGHLRGRACPTRVEFAR